MTELLQLNFGAEARVRGDMRMKRVRHADLSVAIEERDGVGLLLNLSGAHKVEGQVEGSFLSSLPRPGSISVLPPASKCRFKITGTCSVLMLKVGWIHIIDAAMRIGLDPNRVTILPRMNADDRVLGRSLFYAAASGSPDAYDAAVNNLAELLVAPPMLQSARQRSIGLPGTTLQRVLELCRERSANHLRLSELASEAGLSQYHFARSFKIATGCSPHRYLLRCRTERALDLLAGTSLPVGAIAREAGFAHASHLSRNIRRLTGLSPERYRREILP